MHMLNSHAVADQKVPPHDSHQMQWIKEYSRTPSPHLTSPPLPTLDLPSHHLSPPITSDSSYHLSSPPLSCSAFRLAEAQRLREKNQREVART
jgi:hypothetical protein